MASKLLPGTGARVRRGQRRDLARLRVFLAYDPATRRGPFDRRLLADLGTDVYVAEDEGGAIVGVVAVAYVRSLAAGAAAAVLDTARAAGSEAPLVLAELVRFAEERARRRGCRTMRAWPAPDDVALRSVLEARGYDAGIGLVAELSSERVASQ